jgi:hypothetical protein
MAITILLILVIIIYDITMTKKKKENRSSIYYCPSPSLAAGLQEELHFLDSSSETTGQGKDQKLSRRKNTKSKRKYDILERVFKAFVDLVYFVEFIEDHPELHEIYDSNLKELFGIRFDDNLACSQGKNRSSSLFHRFVSSCLLNNLARQKEVDFRVLMIQSMIDNAIQAMEYRFEENRRELELLRNNVQNTRLWSNLLASRYKENEKNALRKIGYCLPLTYWEREKYRGEKRK